MVAEAYACVSAACGQLKSQDKLQEAASSAPSEAALADLEGSVSQLASLLSAGHSQPRCCFVDERQCTSHMACLSLQTGMQCGCLANLQRLYPNAGIPMQARRGPEVLCGSPISWSECTVI